MSALNWLVSTLLLAAFWLLLVNELSVAQAVLGLVLGGAVAFVTALFRPPRLRVRRPGVAVHLLALFLYDIIVANLAKAGSLNPIIQPFSALYVLILAILGPLLTKESERIYDFSVGLLGKFRRSEPALAEASDNDG